MAEKSGKVNLFLKSVTHLVFLFMHVYVNIYSSEIQTLAELSESEELRLFGEYFPSYATFWNAAFQTVFLFLALTCDVLEWMSKHESTAAKKIAYWRDVVFNALVVPYTLFVSAMFWCIYSIDRELVFPKVYDTIVPWWFNHCVHTNITIIVLLETLLTARRKPTCLSLELKLNSLVAFGYAVVYYSIFFTTNRWLYNVFGVMTWWQVCLYQLLIWTSSYVFYFIHFPINRMIHGCDVEEKTEAVSKEGVEDKVEGNGVVKSFEIASMQKGPDFGDDHFSSDNWSLKYRSLRDKFENSRL